MAALNICWINLAEVCLIITLVLFGNINICSMNEKSDCFQNVPTHCSYDCSLPDCYCNPFSLPCDMAESMTLQNNPQLVMITYSGGLTKKVYEGFKELFEDRVNPNSYPMRVTFFVQHDHTDYSAVQDLYSRGHEIGITNQYKEWEKEMNGQCEILQHFANVSRKDCKGLRVVDAKVGGDLQFKVMQENSFTYDHSIKILFNLDSPPPWPYPLNFPEIISDKCSQSGSICPSGIYPSLWAVPVLTDGQCTVMTECFQNKNDSTTFKLLNQRFLHHYNSNKAPFPLWIDAQLFEEPFKQPLKGLARLLKKLEKMGDVYVLPVSEVLAGVMNPAHKDTAKTEQYPYFIPEPRTKSCASPKSCQNVNGFRTCMECPQVYPTLNNPSGNNTVN